MSARFNGYIFAALAAAFYGTNPIFAVPLYGTGMNPVSVLLFRYLLGIPLLAAIIIARSERLLPQAREALPVALLGIIMGLSSLTLYEAYTCMNAGVASTLLFMYPILTSLLMSLLFHEKFRLMTGLCLLIMGTGLFLLMDPAQDAGIDMRGFALIFVSSLLYAVYLVMIKVSKVLQSIPAVQSLLYQLLSGGLVFLAAVAAGDRLMLPATLFDWGNLAALALFPTVLSLLFTIRAIRCIGPTPTAIFGALEPITAVALSILLLGEHLSLREFVGGALIVLATMLVVVGDRNN